MSVSSRAEVSIRLGQFSFNTFASSLRKVSSSNTDRTPRRRTRACDSLSGGSYTLWISMVKHKAIEGFWKTDAGRKGIVAKESVMESNV